jgi:hypothetical protein
MVGEFCHLSSSSKETVTICIGCLGRECFACTMLSACVDSFRLYEDTYQSEDFDLKRHFYHSYLVVSYNGQNEVCFSLHSIQIGITTRRLALVWCRYDDHTWSLGWFAILSIEIGILLCECYYEVVSFGRMLTPKAHYHHQVAVWYISVSSRFWLHVKFRFW